MLYNINNQTLLFTNPSSVVLENGTLITGPINDIEILANAGYYTVRNDGPVQPENTIEDVSLRTFTLDKPYVDITRVWITAPIVVPESISPRQIRLWFIQNNIPLSTVENAINSIEDVVLKEITRVEWEYSPYVERNHPMINNLGAILGLTPEQIDQAFIIASTL
jgi:hypothetical protein